MNTSPTKDQRVEYTELVGVGTSDARKPTFRELRDEGLAGNAIETLMLCRDLLALNAPADEIAAFARLSHEHYPLEVDDVWPDGTPEHWQDEVDPTPIHRWEVTEGVGWSERNARVMAVVAGIESGAVA